MSAVVDRVGEQRARALELANRARMAAADVRREIKDGRLSVRVALDDPRAGGLPVLLLLTAQPKWGRRRARCVLVRYLIAEGLRVRDLTERQRAVLVAATGHDR